VTPTMSTQCVDGNFSENRPCGARNVPVRSRSDHVNLGRFLGDDPPSEMRSPAAANGRANRKAVMKPRDFSDDLIFRQANRIARLCVVSYATAVVIAQLAYGEGAS
jgi:hypothetical protein